MMKIAGAQRYLSNCAVGRGRPRHTPLAVALLTLLNIFMAESVTITVQPGATPTATTTATIQDALDIVDPGDTIEISEGHYFEDLKTRVHGTSSDRITVRAAGGMSNREDVVLRGAGISTRVFEVNHDFYTLEYFTIDGKVLSDPNDDNYVDGYRDKLIYVTGSQVRYERDGGYLSSLDGMIIRHMIVKNAGGECIRLRYFVTNADIYNNEITMCGIHDFVFDDGGKNGEGIYVGTSSNQWDDGKNPTDGPDGCLNNVIRNNVIRTEDLPLYVPTSGYPFDNLSMASKPGRENGGAEEGNEGVDVKEGSEGTIIEYNKIYLQLDTNSGGVDLRGDSNIVRFNHIEDAAGAGVRLGGHEIDDRQFGVNNEVYGNTLVDCRSYGVKIMERPQTHICGNDIALPSGIDDDDYGYTGGRYDDDYDAREPCPFPLVPSPTPPNPEPIPRPTSAPVDEFEGTYLGCYIDGRRRTMSYGFKDKRNMSNPACMEFCLSKGYKYAATQYSIECWCSSDVGFRKYGETDCEMPCSGDSSTICGGRWRQSVYKI